MEVYIQKTFDDIDLKILGNRNYRAGVIIIPILAMFLYYLESNYTIEKMISRFKILAAIAPVAAIITYGLVSSSLGKDLIIPTIAIEIFMGVQDFIRTAAPVMFYPWIK